MLDGGILLASDGPTFEKCLFKTSLISGALHLPIFPLKAFLLVKRLPGSSTEYMTTHKL